MSLGAYTVGALDADEAARVETHLATCPECQAEFEELNGLTALLGRVSEGDIEQVASPPRAVLDRLVAASARRHRVNRILMSAAAAVGVVVVGGAAWLALGEGDHGTTSAARPAVSSPAGGSGFAPKQNQDSPTGTGEAAPASPGPLMATDAPLVLKGDRKGIRAEVTLIPGGAGTTVHITITGVPKGTPCRVVAVGPDGVESPAGSWTVDDPEYRVKGPANFTGHTDLTMERIRAFEFRTSDGELLVSVARS
ncbi:hypothetical protein Ssi03_33020 [Sphaerisporangium siamense]|uniref:Putative zinc-finger domain-containing protein n=2 Tax=Sphaerisporangium siamense TaxID=795645 RepID=A0A7W7D276_9ACTN|nr:hypothetical protein [Sphaerisporangium siamense]GII85312.1 hypothetical protein Ssi03_33020 [Sphaerisporangium siamense]